MKGYYIEEVPMDVLSVAIPLVIYFLLRVFLSYYRAYKLGLNYENTAALSFTAASNNFELGHSRGCGGLRHIASQEVFAAVIGPLMGVLVLISLVNVAFWLRKRRYGISDGKSLCRAVDARGMIRRI